MSERRVLSVRIVLFVWSGAKQGSNLFLTGPHTFIFIFRTTQICTFDIVPASRYDGGTEQLPVLLHHPRLGLHPAI